MYNSIGNNSNNNDTNTNTKASSNNNEIQTSSSSSTTNGNNKLNGLGGSPLEIPRPIVVGAQRSPLVKLQLQGVFIDEIILPYIKVKLDAYYDSLLEKAFDRKISGAGPEPNVKIYNELSLRCPRSYIRRFSQILSRIFFTIYPYISASNEMLQFIIQVLYLFGVTKYYTPLMYLLGVTMTRRQDVPNFVGAFIKSEDDYTKITDFIDVLIDEALL